MSFQDKFDVAGGLAGFSCALYKRLSDKDGNLFFSPYSISSALSLAYLGARGETKTQMAEVLGFRLDAHDIVYTLTELGQSLASDDGKIKAKIGNAAWVQEGLELTEEYHSCLTGIGDLLREVDYKNAAESIRTEINTWVEKITEDLIRNLIPEGVLDKLTRLVLVNAIYFKGEWSSKFDEENTKKCEFQNLEGAPSLVDMMFQPKLKGRYVCGTSTGGAFQAAQINYGDGSVSIAVIMPDDFRRFEDEFSPDSLEAALGMESAKINLTMPKFKTGDKFFLGSQLIQMGMPLAFSDSADFSGITKQEPLKISEVIHQAVIEVSEEGTEAAAATAVVMKRCLSMPARDKIVTLTLDRPFIYLILDQFRTPLFMGRITKL